MDKPPGPLPRAACATLHYNVARKRPLQEGLRPEEATVRYMVKVFVSVQARMWSVDARRRTSRLLRRQWRNACQTTVSDGQVNL